MRRSEHNGATSIHPKLQPSSPQHDQGASTALCAFSVNTVYCHPLLHAGQYLPLTAVPAGFRSFLRPPQHFLTATLLLVNPLLFYFVTRTYSFSFVALFDFPSFSRADPLAAHHVCPPSSRIDTAPTHHINPLDAYSNPNVYLEDMKFYHNNHMAIQTP